MEAIMLCSRLKNNTYALDFLRKVDSLIETNGRNVASLINKQCLAEAFMVNAADESSGVKSSSITFISGVL